MKMITKKDLNQGGKPCEKKERRPTMNGTSKTTCISCNN